ncbi:zinc-dependent alcohol dehydrogenase family protein [Paenibacillus sp. FJAT-26967]|uniref:zinc-dependent alcohol dehydrogenase family protein n=1 Tax=Paenibacillus sp. FJAT-26967 TaxID=1729690 RepID=UPI000837ED7E|nr:zinc-dependent alcohol dehydrogenase family protein [Paenibacillus sp. FJAT-26967]
MEALGVKFYEFGDPCEVLQVEAEKLQQPRNGEVLVRMTARPINPSDLLPVRGAYSHRISLPGVPGYEGVGVVTEVGPSVPQHLLGKRVLPIRGEGTWKQFVRTSADFAVPIPDSMEDETAAQLYINPITAWLICTEVLALKPHDTLLVNACGSSIGRIFAQLSKVLGFKLIAVTRNNAYTEELLELGAECVVDTSETPLYGAVMELTYGRGVHAAIDSIGGADGTGLALCVQPHGSLVTIGLLSGVSVNWAEISKQAQVHVRMFHLRHWNERVSVSAWQATFNHLITLIQPNKIKLRPPAARYSLVEVQEAVRIAGAHLSNQGKIFLI